MNESANQPDAGGSKTVEPSTALDNSEAINFWEPGDDEQTDVTDNSGTDGDETGSETDEADAGQETDVDEDTAEADADDEDGDGEPGDDAKLDETLVTLKGGEQVPVKELKLGYMRLNDYRMKTQETANRGRALETMSNRVATTAHQIAQFLAANMPEEPTPELAYSDPAAYTRQKAMYDVALGNINQILQMGGEPKKVGQQLSTEQHNEMLARENELLTEAFPAIAKPEEREKFFQNAFATGRSLGFTEQEMQQFSDHRYLKVIHYARLGLAAEQAKKTALQKVNNAPAAVPKGKAQGQNAAQARKNQDAMKRLTRTGSIKDAMSIDF